MNRGTIIMIAAALASVAGAVAMRPHPVEAGSFEDTGTLLFESFGDPSVATSLEVVKWDEESAEVRRFAVEQKEGRWVIPSHNDYPADGTERMGKAAASFIDVKKDFYYGDNPADHAAFGVLDPTSSDGKGEEKGERITIKDAAGTVFVDVIVGKAVPDKQGMFYVRLPEEKRVYAARLQLDISTDFGDWIEKDLLHVKRDAIVRLVYEPYQVDEAKGQVVGAPAIAADYRADAEGKQQWQPAEGVKVPSGKLLDASKIGAMASAVANVKIVGVRPRPERLTLPALQSKGFFVTPDGRRLFGNEGQVSAVTEDGLVYTLYFGEVTYESGLALTAGAANGAQGTKDEPSAAEDEGADKTANRYMFVDVAYDPALDQTGAAADGTDETDEVPEAETPADKPAAERVEDLRRRFDKWFYVISDASFKQIHKDPEELFKSKSDAGAKTAPAPGGF